MKLRELLQQMKITQQKIGASEPYICGGTPRDKYMKRLDNISDVDVTTGDKTMQYLAQEFGAELAKKYNVTRQTYGDGHSSLHIGNFKMDFSSNFNTPNIEILLANQGIKKPTEMQKEMFSRDFTCNSLLLSLDLKNIIDPTERGFKDIGSKVIMTCLPPQITLVNHKNRVIRSIYLASKLDFDIDNSIIEFVQKNPQSVQVATTKALVEKMHEAFKRNPDKASYYISKMNLWNFIPITEITRPYYIQSQKNSVSKLAYFQGGGGKDGVNHPTPKKKKYKSDPALVVQPRFKEPLFKNYDLYETPGEHTPGAGLYQNMDKYKSVKDFIDSKRKRNKSKYKADDSWKQDDGSVTKSPNGTKARASLLSKLIKLSIDFPVDEYMDPSLVSGEGDSVGAANLIGGYSDKYLPEDDLENKPPSNLNFGRDYAEADTHLRGCPKCGFTGGPGGEVYDVTYPCPQCGQGGPVITHNSNKLYGLPDGVNLPDEDAGDSSNINPEYGTTDSGNTLYDQMWI